MEFDGYLAKNLLRRLDSSPKLNDTRRWNLFDRWIRLVLEWWQENEFHSAQLAVPHSGNGDHIWNTRMEENR